MNKIKNKLPLIFTFLSMIGVGATAITAIKDSKKEEANALKKYAPTFIVGGATTALIFSSSVLNKRMNLELASAISMIGCNYSNYRSEVAKRHGTEEDQDIIKTISANEANKCHITADCCFSNTSLDLDDIHEQQLVFYDSFSKRFFKSTISKVLQAEYHLNRNFALGACVSINDFYDFLGVDRVDYGEDIGWGSNLWNDGINWIDFNHIKSDKDPSGAIYYIIDYPFGPDETYTE